MLLPILLPTHPCLVRAHALPCPVGTHALLMCPDGTRVVVSGRAWLGIAARRDALASAR